MQQHSILGVVGVVGALALASAAVTTPAVAETSPSPGVWEGKTSQTVGKTVSYKSSKLRVEVGSRKKRYDYIVDKGTSCGYSRGNRGTGMRCSRLGEKQYLAKSVRVVWRTDARKRRIAVGVAVILSPRR